LLYTELEQFTDVFVHINKTLKVSLTDKPEIESVAVMMMVVVALTKAESEEIIVIELLPKLSQIGSGYAAQVILIKIPVGLETIDGSERIRVVPI
jgi:hypothetical protein